MEGTFSSASSRHGFTGSPWAHNLSAELLQAVAGKPLFWAHKRPMSGGRFDVSSLRRGTHAYAHVTVHFSICALTEAIGLKTETDLLMAEPATIQQIRHRPWLKQPRLEYQADFSFGKVIFGPSFLICNMGGPRDPHLLHFNLRCFWNRFSSPKVPTIRIWTKGRSLSACLI